MSLDQLVARFRLIALEQSEALDADDNSKYNRLFDKMQAVKRELKQRSGDQSRVLMPLLTDKNPQVRLSAAISLLKLELATARAVLQDIVQRQDYPQAVDAGSMLDALETGRYVPE